MSIVHKLHHTGTRLSTSELRQSRPPPRRTMERSLGIPGSPPPLRCSLPAHPSGVLRADQRAMPNSRHISAAFASLKSARPYKGLDILPSAHSTAGGPPPTTLCSWHTGSSPAAPPPGAEAAHRHRTLRGAAKSEERRHIQASQDRPRAPDPTLVLLGRRRVLRPRRLIWARLSGSGESPFNRGTLSAKGPLFCPPASALMSVIPAIPRPRRQ